MSLITVAQCLVAARMSMFEFNFREATINLDTAIAALAGDKGCVVCGQPHEFAAYLHGSTDAPIDWLCRFCADKEMSNGTG